MRHLEFDLANSTPNPLYVPKTGAREAAEAVEARETTTSSSINDDPTHTNTRVQEYLHYALRCVLLTALAEENVHLFLLHDYLLGLVEHVNTFLVEDRRVVCFVTSIILLPILHE